jgi:hypothetical protein
MGAYLRYFAIGIIIVLVLLALVLAALDRRSAPRSGASEISFSQLLNEVDANRVRSIVIDGQELRGTFTDGRPFLTYGPNDLPLAQRFYAKNVDVVVRPPPPLQNDLSWSTLLLILLLPIIAMLGAWIFILHRHVVGGEVPGFSKPRLATPLGDNVRRVVTAIDRDGKAVVVFDGANPYWMVRPNRNSVSRLLWTTDASPAPLSGDTDRAAVAIGIAPPAGGSVFRIVDFPPIAPAIEKLDPGQMHRELAADAPKRGLPPRHPLMHRTRTVDYAVVMAGEIDMLLDDSEIHLKAGDVLVQQGTNHAWVNRGSAPCRIAFVLIDAQEP